jgi:hypothetical protein
LPDLIVIERLLKAAEEGGRMGMVSPNTMRTHTKNIYSKLGVHNRRSAVRRAEELDIRLKGHLADRWANWFGGLTITLKEINDE